jgi:tetratricopeptide (TPR) repeat protein
MQELTEIIRHLKRGEVTLLVNFYKAENRGKENKRLELFTLIYKKQVKNDGEASQALYNAPPGSAYAHLKARLRQDICNIILLQNPEAKTATPYGQAMFECRRQLIVGDILLARGAYQPGENLLKSASELAEKFELMPEQILLKDILRTHLGFKKGAGEYQKYTRDIEQHLQLLGDVMKAKDYANNIGLSNMFRKNREHEFMDYAEAAVRELELIMQKTSSVHIAYLYYKTTLFYFQIIKKYGSALEAAQKLLELLTAHTSIYSLPRVADAYLQLSVIYLSLGRNAEALEAAEKAAELFDSRKANYLLAQEMLFHSCIADDDRKAGETVKAAFQHPYIRSNPFMLAKWNYFKANVCFLRKEFTEALELLNKNSELMKDSSGWLIGCKLLELFALIELNKYDLISYRLKAFSQLLYRQKLNNTVRYKTIFQMLEQLHNNNFDFRLTLKESQAALKDLKEGNAQFYRDPVGFEIVRFDQWLESKAIG